MIDNEIMKALECLANGGVTIAKEAFDLINRKDKEIEKLNIELQAMRGAANSYKAEVERLRTQQSGLISEYKNIAIDAIKNFAKRLKAEYKGIDETYHQIFYSNLVATVDNLVKEMVGEDNA